MMSSDPMMPKPDPWAGMDFTSDLAKAERRWRYAFGIQVCVVAALSCFVLFKGVIPAGPSAVDYWGAVCFCAGASIAIGLCGKGGFDDAPKAFPPLVILCSVISPLAGMVGFAINATLVFPMQRVTQPVLVELLSHPYAFFLMALLVNLITFVAFFAMFLAYGMIRLRLRRMRLR